MNKNKKILLGIGITLAFLVVAGIEWFDAGAYLNGASVISSFTNGTTTVIWSNPTPGLHRALNLTKLNMQCLAIQVAASSTSLHVSYRLKD